MRDRHRARISPDLCFPLRAGEERERAHRVDREKGGKSEGWREKEQRKNVSAKQHEFMDEQFYLRCSCSFAAAQRCVYWPASPPSFPASAPPRPCKGRSRLQRLHLQQRARHELSPHPKYRSPPFLSFTPFPRPNSEKCRSIRRFRVSPRDPSSPLIIDNFCSI